ncbi:MAG: hypothetical protein ABIH59_01575 [archaeon]
MLIKILGGIDIALGLIHIFFNQLGVPNHILIILGLILIIKSSVGLLKDFASWIDLIGGILFLVLTIISIPQFIRIIIGVLIIQKGAASFL